MMLMDYSRPRAERLGARWLEAMLLETPSHPTGPTILISKSIAEGPAASPSLVPRNAPTQGAT